jgi:hypothetical protein
MSSVNLHKKFALKIVEAVHFAEIPAHASVKGRPKNVPHLRTGGAMLLDSDLENASVLKILAELVCG